MSTIPSIVKNLSDASIGVIGDIMLDIYVYGSVDRISPEAPVPVLKPERRSEMLGGAGNVVRNLQALGAKVDFFSVTGDDENGRKVHALLKALPEVKRHMYTCGGMLTTSKTRFVSTQQLLRLDEENQFNIPLGIKEDMFKDIASGPARGALIISDYGKGVLTKDFCERIIGYSCSRDVPVFVDPKGQDYEQYRNATLIKPNRKELSEVFHTSIRPGDEARYAKELVERLNISYCLVTMGKDGMLLVGKGVHQRYEAMQRNVVDVAGAGDTVIAAVAAAYAAGASIEDACFVASIAAGIAVAKAGTSVASQDEILAGEKVMDESLMEKKIAQWRKQHYTIGFTNGCFDLLHSGHISTIQFAKKYCDKLIVALNSDMSVRMLKGESRPIQNEMERARIVGALECVDAVIIFEEETPERCITRIRPDVLIKGGDYSNKNIVGADFVEAYGGMVICSEFIEGYSSTAMIKRLQSL